MVLVAGVIPLTSLIGLTNAEIVPYDADFNEQWGTTMTEAFETRMAELTAAAPDHV
jgi:hypothetical protein